MKLIKEFLTDTKILEESVNGEKHLYVTGIFLQSGIKNRNGRLYPEEVMDKEVNRYITESVNTSRAFGELTHPSEPTINLKEVSHLITELKKDGKNYFGKARILDTPMGNIAAGIIRGGGQLGVSSRALGSLKTQGGVRIVQNDFRLSTAADLVADPSAPDAFVQGIMENKEWIFVDGKFEEEQIDEAKSRIKTAKSSVLNEAALSEFKIFLQSLK